MKNKKLIALVVCIVLLLGYAYMQSGRINLPGHGNRENRNLQEAVINHVSAGLTEGETVEFDSKHVIGDYKDNGEMQYSANVVYYIVNKDGTKVKRTANVTFNEDKDQILEWEDLDN